MMMLARALYLQFALTNLLTFTDIFSGSLYLSNTYEAIDEKITKILQLFQGGTGIVL